MNPRSHAVALPPELGFRTRKPFDKTPHSFVERCLGTVSEQRPRFIQTGPCTGHIAHLFRKPLDLGSRAERALKALNHLKQRNRLTVANVDNFVAARAVAQSSTNSSN